MNQHTATFFAAAVRDFFNQQLHFFQIEGLSFDSSDLLISDLSRPQTGFGGFPQTWHKTPPSKKR